MFQGFKKLEGFLAKNQKFIISTHESPDGDGLGAEIAFKELLTSLNKTAYILNSDPIPDKFLFIDPDNEINIFNNNANLPVLEELNEYAVFVLDTNDFDNIGAAYNHIKDTIKDVFIIDHHEGGNDKFEDNFIKAEASSASEIIFDIIKYYNKKPSFKAAQALYAGILFDTGSFRYPKTTPGTFRIIANLVELGANPFNIYEKIYESNSLDSFELRARMLASMQIHFNKKLILMKLTKEMLQETGAPFTEGELNINLPLTVDGVVASVLVKQNLDGQIKVSMRTKGNYDVAEIAMARGGGGHKNAAGYKSKISFDETCNEVIKEMSKFFPQN
jgi:bifunctional oligoribonuclease and PAP phosphatase NrnA